MSSMPARAPRLAAILFSVSALAAIGIAAGCSAGAKEDPPPATKDAAVDAPLARDTGVAIDAAPDAASDVAVDATKPPLVGVACPTELCKGGESCCAVDDFGSLKLKCQVACDNQQVPLTCDGVEDCNNGSICCASVASGVGQAPQCPITGVNASCRPSCTTDLSQQCNRVNTVKPCHAAADCAGDSAGATNCCEFASAGTPVAFCAPAPYRAAASRCFD
jgi:hypothetical protein